MASPIELFEEMSALSARMVAAAQAQDWARLVDLERAVVALRDALMTDNDDDLLSAAELELKTALIQRILDDDAEVRRHTEPWMEQLRKYLGGTAQHKPGDSAFGASA